jgi:uncharacterized membrane protein YkvA (DUF1232 family)
MSRSPGPDAPGTSWLGSVKEKLAKLKTETYALYLAAKDPRTPWYARAVIVAVVAYAVSPIDLIPDFIPVLGYLDDLLLLPLGIALALRLVPQAVMAESRETARTVLAKGIPGGKAAAAVILLIWLALAGLLLAALLGRDRTPGR